MNTTLDMFFNIDGDDKRLKLGISQIEYSIVNNKPIIHIFGRTKDGKLRKIDVSGFRPYFYIPKDQIS